MSARGRIETAVLLAGLCLLVGCSSEPSAQKMQAWNAEIHRLEAEQDSLRRRGAELVNNDPRIQSLPKGDVVIIMPTAFIRSVIQRVFDDVVSNVTLSVRGIKAHIAKSLKKVVTIGEFVVDVDIHEVVGKLRPHQPDIRFADDRISMSLPVEVAEGSGDATIHFVWNGKNIADAACGDLDITQKVSGRVIPARYVVHGRLDLAMDGNQVIGTPVFPETRLRLRVEPSKQSWAAINAILAEKRGVCGWVLDRVNVPQLLKNLVEEKGFNVKLPVNKIKPFTIPAGVRDSVAVGDRTVFITTETKSIRIEPDAILYSARVELK